MSPGESDTSKGAAKANTMRKCISAAVSIYCSVPLTGGGTFILLVGTVGLVTRLRIYGLEVPGVIRGVAYNGSSINKVTAIDDLHVAVQGTD